MIIGAILDVSNTSQGTASSTQNGTAIMMFYTMEDAIVWARIQSQEIISGTNPNTAYALCTVINTQTEQRRWWFAGIEYTG